MTSVLHCAFPDIYTLPRFYLTAPVFNCTRERSFSHMKRITSVLRSSRENEQLGPSEQWGRHCPENCLYRHIIDLFTAAKQGKDCFKCFVLRTCLQFWISFSFTFGPKILLLSFQCEKILFFQLLRLLYFEMSWLKGMFQVGPGAPDLSGAPGPMWS